MENHVYKHIEITGTSSTSSDDAIRMAIAKAGQTVRHLRWFEVTDMRGDINDGKVVHWQATIKLGFRIDAEEENQ